MLAGIAQRSPRADNEVVEILARRARELERAGVVVRNHLCVILGTTERLDPLGGTRVLLRPLGARNLPVRDVAHQDMLERELRLAGDRAAPRALHELLLLQRVQALLADTERAEPEHLAQHRGVLQHRLLLRRQPIQARGDDPLHGLRQVDGGSALGQHAHVLLCVERITAGAVEELGLRAGLEQRPVAQRRNQLRRLVGRQRRQRDVRGVELPSGPRRASLEQLQPRGAEDQHRDISHPVREMLDEVEQALVGPLQILEDEDERVIFGERFEEAPPRCERLVLRSGGVAGLPDERTQVCQHPVRVLVDQLLDGARELRRDLVVAVRLEDAGLRLHHLRRAPSS